MLNVHINQHILLSQILHSLGHNSQIEAAKEIHTYQPLVKINCSADIQLFLCSMYAPPCTILGKKFDSDMRPFFTWPYHRIISFFLSLLFQTNPFYHAETCVNRREMAVRNYLKALTIPGPVPLNVQSSPSKALPTTCACQELRPLSKKVMKNIGLQQKDR